MKKEREMLSLTHKIKAENGMHARPAGAFAVCAKKFTSDIKVRKGEKEADAKRLLSLMGLGAVYSDVIEVTISGEDEKNAYEEIKSFLEQSL